MTTTGFIEIDDFRCRLGIANHSWCRNYFMLCSKYTLKLCDKNDRITITTYNYYARRVYISQNIHVQRLLLHGCFN